MTVFVIDVFNDMLLTVFNVFRFFYIIYNTRKANTYLNT